MKTNTVPIITRKFINSLPRGVLNDLARNLEALYRKHGDSLIPANKERALKALNFTHARKAVLKRSFYKNMSYKGPNFRMTSKPNSVDWNEYQQHMGFSDERLGEVIDDHTAAMKGEQVIYTRNVS